MAGSHIRPLLFGAGLRSFGFCRLFLGIHSFWLSASEYNSELESKNIVVNGYVNGIEYCRESGCWQTARDYRKGFSVVSALTTSSRLLSSFSLPPTLFHHLEAALSAVIRLPCCLVLLSLTSALGVLVAGCSPFVIATLSVG